MSNYKSIFDNQVSYYHTHMTKDIELRISTLNNLRTWIIDHEDLIYNALKADLGKTREEAYMSEVGFVLDAITYSCKNIKKFHKKHHVRTPLHQFFAKSYYLNDPYGTVLIISSWNYPFLLAIEPLVYAIAAGNCVIVKPNEFAYETSLVIKQMIDTVFDSGHVAAINATFEQSEELLGLDFDYIFFTGSYVEGQHVYAAAAKKMIPVTLSLGGKSPCIVTDMIPTDIAAKRILFGKCLNAGQSRISPDYLFVHESVKDSFIENINKYIEEFFGTKPLKNANLTRIVNKRQYERLKNLLKDQKILAGGHYDEKTLKIEPTFVEADKDNILMKEEIFGPIMPVITYKSLDDVVKYINSQPKPLALYLFSDAKEEQEQITRECAYGCGCINDTLSQYTSKYLPLGGIGNSGVGQYREQYSLETFSRKKAILQKNTKIDTSYRYYPFDEKKTKTVKKLLK